jgi:hypothetical protein
MPEAVRKPIFQTENSRVPLPNGLGTVLEFKVFLVARIKSFNTFFNLQLMLYRHPVFANNPTHEIEPI